MIEEILSQVKEVARQPADILKMVEDYLRKLGRRAALWELSIKLEKEMALGRTEQLKVMEAEVEKLQAASGKATWLASQRGIEPSRTR
jgi:hypothetical protein